MGREIFGRNVTRDSLILSIDRLELEWGDEEDAHALVELLLQCYTPAEAATWLLFYCIDLKGAPIYLLQKGRGRSVFQYARDMLEEANHG